MVKPRNLVEKGEGGDEEIKVRALVVLDSKVIYHQGKEQASTSTQSSSSRSEEDQRVMNVTVMSKDKEITTALTVLGKFPNPPEVQQKTEDSAKPVHEDNKDESIMEVDYEPFHQV